MRFNSLFIFSATTSEGKSSSASHTNPTISARPDCCSTASTIICLLSRYASRNCRLTRLRLTARLKWRLDTLISTLTGGSPSWRSVSLQTALIGNEATERLPALSKSCSVSRNPHNRSCLLSVWVAMVISVYTLFIYRGSVIH